jgi:hypothetical protein
MDHFFQNIEGWSAFIGVYDHAVRTAKDGFHFVEVGAWKGRSAAFMAVHIANSGKNIKFDVVDTWLGSPEHSEEESVKNNTLYEEFIANMEPVKDYYTPLRMTSLEASLMYEDESLDLVLLDAAHDYDNVKADILAWLPKIKKGGILAGDDYHPTWSGVIKAVTECIPKPQVVDISVWFYIKT